LSSFSALASLIKPARPPTSLADLAVAAFDAAASELDLAFAHLETEVVARLAKTWGLE
jgi:hypothetical protein